MAKKNQKKTANYKKSLAKIRPTNDGLHLDGSILWFDSKDTGHLSFLSSASSVDSTRVPQVITTEETIKILEAKRKKVNALVCQYNRPFSIGRLKMELLPSGSILGGASLYVENGDSRILYAPHVQTQKSNIVRQLQLKKASTLVLGAFHEDPSKALPNRRKEKDRLVKKAQELVENGEFPVILCKSVGSAQEITKILTDQNLPVAVHDSIYKINRIYETYGASLGSYSLYSRRRTKNKIVLLPLNRKGRAPIRMPLPDRPVFYVEETMDESLLPEALRNVADRFYLSTTSDGKELREVINAVNPKEVYVYGPYAKRYCEDLGNMSCEVRPLFSNDQPTLF